MTAQSPTDTGSIDPFDPGGFFEFDLSEGSVHTNLGTRVLVLSDTVLAPLVSAAVRHGDLTPVRRLGKQIGEHIKASLGIEIAKLDSENVLGHISATLALFGWGRLVFERWGHALVVSISELPELDEDELGSAALLGGVFSTLSNQEVACVPVSPGRFIVVSPDVAEQIWNWAKSGATLATIVGRLSPQGNP